MDAKTLYLQTLYNGLVDQGKPVPVRLRELLNRDAPNLLLQHPTGTWRDDLLTCIEFESPVLSLAIRPACSETNGRDWLAVGLDEGKVHVLDLTTGKLLWLGLGHVQGVCAVQWSLNGLLGSGGRDGSVLVWQPDLEVAEGVPLWRGEEHTSQIRSISWSSTGLLATAAEKAIRGTSSYGVQIWKLR